MVRNVKEKHYASYQRGSDNGCNVVGSGKSGFGLAMHDSGPSLMMMGNDR
jgi:hypothetical protein